MKEIERNRLLGASDVRSDEFVFENLRSSLSHFKWGDISVIKEQFHRNKDNGSWW